MHTHTFSLSAIRYGFELIGCDAGRENIIKCFCAISQEQKFVILTYTVLLEPWLAIISPREIWQVEHCTTCIIFIFVKLCIQTKNSLKLSENRNRTNSICFLVMN